VPGISKTLDEVCEKAIDFMVAIRPEVLSTKNPKVMSTAHELMTTINNSGYYKCPICKKPMKELPRVDTPVHITVCQDKDCIHKQLLAAEVKKA
jgi:hypothetical protein